MNWLTRLRNRITLDDLATMATRATARERVGKMTPRELTTRKESSDGYVDFKSAKTIISGLAHSREETLHGNSIISVADNVIYWTDAGLKPAANAWVDQSRLALEGPQRGV